MSFLRWIDVKIMLSFLIQNEYLNMKYEYILKNK